MKNVILIFILLPLSLLSQSDSVQSGAYQWKQPVTRVPEQIASAILLEGKVHSFEWLELTANAFTANKPVYLSVLAEQEQLLIIKKGVIAINLNDTVYELTAGSVAVLMPGQKYSLQNKNSEFGEFYSMRYTAKEPVNRQRGGVSFIQIWENTLFKKNDIGGGRRDFFDRPTAMQKRFEMHVTTLKEGVKSHEPHTHRAEEIVMILEGQTEMQLRNEVVQTSAGGFYYLGSNVLHAIKNIGEKPSTYFAFQFE